MLSLHRNALGKVSRLVHIRSARAGGVVSQQLQRHHVQQWAERAIVLGHADIDIRYGAPHWPQLAVRPIFEEQVMPLASPAFIKRHRIASAEDLMHVPLIQSTVGVVQWPDWFAAQNIAYTPGSYAYRFDRAFMALDAAVQGLGVTFESTSIAAPHLQKHRLKPVFASGEYLPVQAHFLVYPERHAQRPEVMRFVDWILERATATPDEQMQPARRPHSSAKRSQTGKA